MQRVLHVLNNLGSGGAEAFIMNVYRKIDRSKLQFDFLIRSDKNGPYVDEIKAMGGRVYQTADFPRHIMQNYRELNRFFKEHHKDYSAVHVHANSLLYIKPLQLAKTYNIPCRIIHSHSISTDTRAVKAIHSFNKPRMNRYVNARFACSAAAGEWMFGCEEYRVITNGVDLKKYAFDPEKREAVRQRYAIKDDQTVIGHVGRFSYPKNHPFIIRVFQQFLQSHPNSVLMLVGDGDGMQEIKALVKSLSIDDRVLFIGAVSNVDEYLCAMDVFLFPSLFEGFPVALVEAQASGLPCVLSDAIPSDSVLNTNCCVHSLQDDAVVWTKALEETVGRIPPCEAVSRYDSAVTAKELEDYYLSFC